MVIVDRIEDGVAVLEGESGRAAVPAGWLPRGALEGSVLQVDIRREEGTSRVELVLDPAAQTARESEIRQLRESIPEGPGGDLAL